MEYLDWIIENWYIVLGLVAVIAMIGFAIYKFFGLPTNEQIEKIKGWMLQAVIEAEAELGSGTGKVKLSKVYDMFITKFPMTAKFITFKQFSDLVDIALDEMRKMLETNVRVKEIVEK